MREIEFRGYSVPKMIGSQWLYGFGVMDIDYVDGTIEWHLHTLNGTYEIHPKSIGQYTGLKDKNGKKIYEGDIVKASSQGVWGTFEVKWRQEGLPCWILYPAFQKGEFWKLHGTKQKDGSYKDDVEIVGNVFENPELITA